MEYFISFTYFVRSPPSLLYGNPEMARSVISAANIVVLVVGPVRPLQMFPCLTNLFPPKPELIDLVDT